MARICPACSSRYEDEIFHCPEDGRKTVAEAPKPPSAQRNAAPPPPAPEVHRRPTQIESELEASVQHSLDDDEETATGVEADELLGRSIGSYAVTRLLGEGGMGSVYMAEHPVIGSRVAIKFLHPRFSNDKKIVDRFFNEARAVNLIGHDNILKILDLNVTEEGRHYFVMEFLQGKSLADLMTPDVPLPLEVTGPILLQFCEALQAAHEKKIYHRDIKPDNIYLIVHKGRKNFVKVVDFGIAKLTDKAKGSQATGQTQTGMVMGTPAYMSPEQAGGMGDRIGPTSDVYSTGVMMYQLATGKLPFPSTNFGEVLIGHLQLPPPPPREENPDLPAAYEEVILRALAKKQSDRQGSMKQLQAEIKNVMDDLGISAELPRAQSADLPTAPPSPGRAVPKTPSRALTAAPSRKPPPQVERKGPPPGATTQLARPPGDRSQLTAHMLAPPPPSRLPLFVGIGVLAVALLGGAISWSVWHSASDATRRSLEVTERTIEKARRAARAEVERARAETEEESARRPVPLIVTSVPSGAAVIATWPGGSSGGKTDFMVEVPHNATVTFQFSKEGYVPYTRDVIATQSQTVSASLSRIPSGRTSAPRRASAGSSSAGGDADADDVLPIGDDLFNEKK